MLIFALALPALYAGSLIMAEKMSHLAVAVVGGAIVGLLEGLFRTGRLFSQSAPPPKAIRVFSLILCVAALLVVGVTGMSLPTLLAYAIPWFLSAFAVFVWDEHQHGS